MCLALLRIARRFSERLKDGYLFLIYVCLFCVGRLLVEAIRVDPAFLIGGLMNGNFFVSGLTLGSAIFLYLGPDYSVAMIVHPRRLCRRRPGVSAD